MSSAYLTLRSSEGEREIPLVSNSFWRIGRAQDSEICLAADTLVSRHHGLVQRSEGGSFYLLDVGSRNGSWVNGRRVMTPIRLASGDEILIGDTKIVFHQADDPRVITAEVSTETQTGYACRRISVMVIDIRDFTGLSQRTDENVLCQTIGTWFRGAGEIMQVNGSWSQKYIGDAVMAVWLHQVGKEHVELLRMIKALRSFVEFTATLHQKFGLGAPLRIGAGINTGFAMIGNAGSPVASDYTALGDTVNAAFRFESVTKVLGVDTVIGEATYEALQAAPVSLDAFQPYVTKLKGYDKPMKVFGVRFDSLPE